MEMFNKTHRKRVEAGIEMKSANDNVTVQDVGERLEDLHGDSLNNNASTNTLGITEKTKRQTESFLKVDRMSQKGSPKKKLSSYSIENKTKKHAKKKKIIKSLRIRLPKNAILGTIRVLEFSDKDIWNNLTMFRSMMKTLNQSLCQALRSINFHLIVCILFYNYLGFLKTK
jgi:hypothetical protein